MFFLGWHEIRQTLYESLPQGMVSFGKRFDSYSDEGESGVVVRFKVTSPPEHDRNLPGSRSDCVQRFWQFSSSLCCILI